MHADGLIQVMEDLIIFGVAEQTSILHGSRAYAAYVNVLLMIRFFIMLNGSRIFPGIIAAVYGS